MAQACPSLILDSVLKKLGSPTFQKIKLNWRLRIQLGTLRSKLELIGDVLDEAEGMAVLFPKFVGKWVCDLQSVLFELDDILDEDLTRSMPASAMLEKVRLCLYNLPFDLTVAHKIKEINNRLASIVEECFKCNLIVDQPAGNQREKPVAARKGILRYNPHYVRGDDFCMIGRDADKKKVIQMLFDENPDETIVWINGNPGVGKTTLCRAVYNDEDVKNRFEIRSWVSFRGRRDFSSVEFWKKIIRSLLEADEIQVPKTEAETEEEDTEAQLEEKVINFIRNRKTLVVLDSFTSCFDFFLGNDSRLRFRLKAVIASSNKGSKILVSRSKQTRTWLHATKYSDHAKPGPQVECECDLSEEHCWSIFENTALVPGHDRAEQPPPEWMIDLGKQIVTKCSRHPALLKGVGTMLYGKEDRSTWEYFARDYDFDDRLHHYFVYSNICNFFPACQYNLGYLSLFSKHAFKYEALIQQFAAHGFTDLSKKMRRAFEEELLFLVKESKDNWDAEGKYRFRAFYKDAILQLAGAECAFLEWMQTYLHEEARNVSFARPSESYRDQRQQDRILPDSLIRDVIHRRSLLFLGELFPIRMSVQTLDKLVSNLQYLRVLDLQDMALQVLPTSVGKLIHLRYLDLSRNDFRVLPRSICRLQNLLTLKLNYCDKLISLPQRIKKLSHLKHLEINMCLDLTDMPSSIASMTCLERLDRFIVNPHSGGLGYLEHLNNLNGYLSIVLPRHWEKSKADAERANLERKKGLTSLEFKWLCADNDDEINDDTDVLEKLKPCNGIENLSILKFGGKTLSSWITSLGMERNLTKITISQCKRCEILPSFHEMPSLEFLTLTSMNIEYLQDANLLRNAQGIDFFPSLEVLKIGRMPKLKGWWNLGLIGFSIIADGLPRFPNIETLEIWNCPRLTMMPPFSNFERKMVLQDVSDKMLQSIVSDCSKVYCAEIISIQDMIVLPDQMLIKPMSTIEVKGCNSLQTLWVDHNVEGIEVFANVHTLIIANCPTMKHLSSNLRCLSRLKYLTVSKCSEELDCLYEDKENGMPWKSLRDLRSLTIEGFQNLVTLPKGLQHLPSSFETLDIANCPTMKYMSSSLRQLIHLKVLVIAKCSEELDCLYEEDDDGMPWKALHELCMLRIEGYKNLVFLPKGLQQLHKLYSLKIKDCRAMKWEFGSLPKSEFLTIKSCPHFSTKIKELETEHGNVKLK